MSLHLIEPRDCLNVFRDVAEMLQPAIDRSQGRWELWDVVAQVLQGEMNLWVATTDGKPVAAMVTRFVQYPRMKALGLMFVGGTDRDAWLHHEKPIREWALSQGATEFEGYMRPGWYRVNPGWDQHWTFATKDLTDGG